MEASIDSTQSREEISCYLEPNNAENVPAIHSQTLGKRAPSSKTTLPQTTKARRIIHPFEIGGFSTCFFLVKLAGFPRFSSSDFAYLAFALLCCGVCAILKSEVLKGSAWFLKSPNHQMSMLFCASSLPSSASSADNGLVWRHITRTLSRKPEMCFCGPKRSVADEYNKIQKDTMKNIRVFPEKSPLYWGSIYCTYT